MTQKTDRGRRPRVAKKRDAAEPLSEHVARQAGKLLRKFASEVEKSRDAPNPDAVHDLRVSIRRFGQCLRIFGQFFPGGKRKRVRRRLKQIMRCAAEVRNRDIAIDLLTSLGVPAKVGAVRRLAGSRAQAAGELGDALDRWHSRGVGQRWRTQLEV